MSFEKRLKAIRGLQPMPENERYQYDISHLKVGAYFTFQGQNWKVIDIAKYLQVQWETFNHLNGQEWTIELTIFSLKTGKTRYIEYSRDDQVEIFLTDKEIKLSQLGITRAKLKEIAEEEKGTISFDSKSFHYSDDETRAALYFRGDDQERMKVRFYEFEASDGTCLTIESWHDDLTDKRPDREAFISKEILSSQIQILQLGETK